MKISKKLPQFKNKRTLIVITGKQEGKFYLAYKGIIEKLTYFKFTKPKYSDREGHFVTKGGAGKYKTGSVYEPKKEKLRIELIKRLQEKLKTILKRRKIDSIYIACPEYLKNRIKDAFPSSASKKIDLVIFGDYCHSHVYKLLEKIKEKIGFKNKPVRPAKKSARKIICKSKKARKVIKGKP